MVSIIKSLVIINLCMNHPHVSSGSDPGGASCVGSGCLCRVVIIVNRGFSFPASKGQLVLGHENWVQQEVCLEDLIKHTLMLEKEFSFGAGRAGRSWSPKSVPYLTMGHPPGLIWTSGH